MKIFSINVFLNENELPKNNEGKEILGKCDNSINEATLICDISVNQNVYVTEDNKIIDPLETIIHELSHALLNFGTISQTGDPKKLIDNEDDPKRINIEKVLLKELLGK